jgi:hypothetical protein
MPPVQYSEFIAVHTPGRNSPTHRIPRHIITDALPFVAPYIRNGILWVVDALDLPTLKYMSETTCRRNINAVCHMIFDFIQARCVHGQTQTRLCDSIHRRLEEGGLGKENLADCEYTIGLLASLLDCQSGLAGSMWMRHQLRSEIAQFCQQYGRNLKRLQLVTLGKIMESLASV